MRACCSTEEAPGHRARLRTWLSALALAALACSAQAQLNLPGQAPAKAAGNETATTLPADVRKAASEQLAEARRQQEAGRLAAGGGADGDELPNSERQRLLDQLVAAYGARLNLLDEAEGLKKSSPRLQEKTAQLIALADTPPYPTLHIDALRDEFDLIRERLKHRISIRQIQESQKQSLIEAQRRAAEALRLAEDQLARARGAQNIERERDNRAVAALRLQLTEAELVNLGVGMLNIETETQALQAYATDLEALLARIVPKQTLERAALDEQLDRLRANSRTLTREIDRRVAGNSKRVAERERLARSLTGSGEADSASRQLKLLDEMLETDRIVQVTLTWLQTLIQSSIDSWTQRYAALAAADANDRVAAITALSSIKSELASKEPLLHEFGLAAQSAIDQQELRLKSSLLDSAAAEHEAAVLDTIKQRLLAIQRVELAAQRLDSRITRWLGDFGVMANPGSALAAGDWQMLGARIGGALKQVWNFELFAVEDSTVVEGKTITTSYGVTVGKSIGMLFLYAFAYWVLGRLARVLEGQMIRRFRVNEQAASVIRRWIMIAVSVVLVIMVLNLARIPLTAFAFMGGALAIGIGFGTQTIIKNVISGVIILFERKIRVGDIIALGGTTGYVTAVDLRASTVRSFDGVEALVPNSTFLEQQVVNWTYSNNRIRREIRIGIAYGSPVRQAADIILGCAADHGQVLKEPVPEVYLEDFADNALAMTLIFWVELSPGMAGRRVDSDLRFMMEKRLGAASNAIPYPQRDVHLDLGQPLPVRVVPDGPVST